jgi:hypothetical protein
MKLATIATLAAGASAHHHHHHKWYKDHKAGDLPHYPIQQLITNYFNGVAGDDKPTNCEIQENSLLVNLMRMKQVVYTNAVRGFYQDRIENDISEKCLSDEGLQKLDKMIDIIYKLKDGDFFGVSVDDYKDAIMDLVDLVYTEHAECKFMVPIQDVLHWCGANTDKCIHKVDLIQRLQDNVVDMAFTLWDLYRVVTRDLSCEDDNETLIQIGKATYDIAKMYSE